MRLRTLPASAGRMTRACVTIAIFLLLLPAIATAQPNPVRLYPFFQTRTAGSLAGASVLGCAGTDVDGTANSAMPCGVAGYPLHVTIDGSTAGAPSTAAQSVQNPDGSTIAGAQADAAYAGSGATSVIGALKGLFAALAGTLKVQGVAGGTALPVSLPPIPAGSNLIGSVTDTNSAPTQGVVAMTSGTAISTPIRAVRYLCATQGTATFTFADSSTQTVTLLANTFPFGSIDGAISAVTQGTATGCTFWGAR